MWGGARAHPRPRVRLRTVCGLAPRKRRTRTFPRGERGNHGPELSDPRRSLSSGVGCVPFASSAWSRSVPVSRSSWPRGGHGGTRRVPTISRSTTLAGLRASSERIAGCIAKAWRNSMAYRFLESPQEQRIAAPHRGQQRFHRCGTPGVFREQRPHRVSAGDRAPWPPRSKIEIPRTVSTAISIGNRQSHFLLLRNQSPPRACPPGGRSPPAANASRGGGRSRQ